MKLRVLNLLLVVGVTLWGTPDARAADCDAAEPDTGVELTLEWLGPEGDPITFDGPVDILSPPGDMNRLFVVLKGGTIRINAQNPLNHLGKIFRLDVDLAGPPYYPASNPYVDEAGVLPEIWALGVRVAYVFRSADRGSLRRRRGPGRGRRNHFPARHEHGRRELPMESAGG